MRSSPLWGMVIFFSGVGVRIAALGLGLVRESRWYLAVGLGVVTITALLGAFTYRDRRRLAPFALDCAACGAPLIPRESTSPEWEGPALVIATGNCPRCGARVAE